MSGLGIPYPPHSIIGVRLCSRRMEDNVIEWAKRNSPVLVLVLAGFIYVGKCWSPSSYALAFRYFGTDKDGLVAGEPRGIRSDEWAVTTPLTQVTVNNGLRRYNATSYYHEDLRTCHAMPLLDWGMLFKPNMWLYPLVNAAYAFSFYWYSLIFLFVIGYWRFFIIAGASTTDSFLLSLVLFFTGYVQHFWTTIGPCIAFFPWLFIALEMPLAWAWRLLIFYWVATCWILAWFYPPAISLLAFVAALFLLAFRPNMLKLRPVLGLGAASAAAVATAGVYLKDYLAGTWNTVYPGLRRVGGGGFGFDLWISHFLPTSQISHHQPLMGLNICEIGVVGSFYLLMVLCFLDYARWKDLAVPRRTRVALAIFGTGLLAVYSWLFLPLPSWVGAPLLWDRVPAGRMAFGAGLLLLVLAAIAANSFGLKLSWARFHVLSAVVFAGWYRYKLLRSKLGILDSWLDWAVLLPLGILVVLKPLVPSKRVNTAFLIISAIMGSLAFGAFNPLQSAWPIFNRPMTDWTRYFDRLSQMKPGMPLAIPNIAGAVLNGWGYSSINHVLPVPPLKLWERIFPEIGKKELNDILNRYALVQLVDRERPLLIECTVVGVPIKSFPFAIPSEADRQNSLGLALWAQGRAADAIRHYRKALELLPSLSDAHTNLGAALDAQGHEQEAVAQYMEALRLKPDDAVARFNLGLHFHQRGRITEAITQYREALRIKPDNPGAQNNLGVALQSLGTTAEAMEHFQEALRLKPDYAPAHFGLGICLDTLGRRTEGLAHYETALRLEPGYAAARERAEQDRRALAPGR